MTKKAPTKPAPKAPPPRPATPKREEKVVNPPPRQSAEPIPQADTAAITKAVHSPMALLKSAPEWLAKAMEDSDEGPRGLEEMDAADLILPRIVLAQALTPEVVEGRFPAGTLFDNLTKEVILEAPKRNADGQVINVPKLEIIPVILGKARFFFKPMSEGGGILCRSMDALTAQPGGCGKDKGDADTKNCLDCVFKDWTEEGGESQKPRCSIFYNVVVLLPSRGMRPYVWSNKHTNVKGIKRFLSAAKQTGADFFAQKHSLSTKLEKNAQFSWHNYEANPVGWVTKEEYDAGLQFYNSMKGKTWAASTEDLEQEVQAEDEARSSPDEGVPPQAHTAPPTPVGGEEDPF